MQDDDNQVRTDQPRGNLREDQALLLEILEQDNRDRNLQNEQH